MARESQSAFVRGFIDDAGANSPYRSGMRSQSAFVRGFIDDRSPELASAFAAAVSIRVRARLHR